MKKMKRLVSVLIALCAALSLCACGSSSGSSSDSSSDLSEGNTFTFGCNNFSEYIDPTVNVDSAWMCMRFGVGEALFAFDSDGNIYENLCDSYETDDYITWTLHIREGVTFSNGKELTPSAIKECFDFYYEKEAEGGTILLSQYLDDAVFEADDDAMTLTVVCAQAEPNLTGILAYPFFVVIDIDAYEEGVIDSVIGTGPYVLSEYVEAYSRTFVANENYWAGEVPYDGYTALFMDDSTTKAMAIESNSVDVVENITTSSDLETLNEDPEYTVVSNAGARVATTYFNFQGVLANDTLRQAIQYAIDDETICSVTVGGIYTAGYSVLPSSLNFGYDELTDPYEYDLDKAVELLDEAGIVDTDGDGIRELDGENIELVYLVYESRQLEDLAEATATILESIGIGVDYEIYTYDTILSDLQPSGAFDMVTANTLAVPTGDPTQFLSNWYSGYSDAYGFYSNEEYDALYEELTAAMDEDERLEIIIQMQQILIDDAAVIVHGYYNCSIVYNNTVMEGIEMYPFDYIWITTEWSPAE